MNPFHHSEMNKERNPLCPNCRQELTVRVTWFGGTNLICRGSVLSEYFDDNGNCYDVNIKELKKVSYDLI